MELLGKIVGQAGKKTVLARRPDGHLHSASHLLADELATKLNDKKHFGFYLKMALTHNHDFLRGLLGQVLESKTVKSQGKLFAFLIKKSKSNEK